MRKLLTGITAGFCAVILVFSAEGISASSAVMMDGETGQILYEKNANSRALIASTTKIMTGLLICEHCNVLDRVKIPREAVGIEGSSMYLEEDEILTVQELLYGLMLRSGNDAAVALAIYCGGTVEGFAALMNDKARELGMNRTHFENPNGLDSPGHYSTAADMAVLCCYAMKNPIFKQTVSTKKVKIGDRLLVNHNKLLWQIPGADGIKTGYTRAAGRILASSAVRNGRRLVVVTIAAPDDWRDHKYLYHLGYEKYKPTKLLSKGDVLGYLQVVGGQKPTVPILAEKDFVYSLQNGERPYMVLPSKRFFYAPVSRGEQGGSVHLFLGDQKIGTVPFCYGDTVEQEIPPYGGFWSYFWKKE